ncbi:L-type lectin-domain containing receptor kinase IX.1-like [Triticum aestivum]|uniref:L-type lectin-domain containing receptor kinase IX.1-like n=1 Tax=Triticum aestivum TaxID=4565 RepID=UPI001D00A41B|nr:L-type lectin-domain containing receptor kinase IX.1-like [Triticum aestivum]
MSPHHLLSVSGSVYILCLCYSLSLLTSSAPPAGLATALSFSFNFSDSSGSGDLCDTEVRCERDTRMGPGAIELTKNEIRDNLYSLGRASYVHPVTLWDNTTGEVASFSSNFTFQIRLKNETDGQLRGLCGSSSTPNDGVADGMAMAFFLAHYPSRLPPNSVGGNLALFNDNNNLDATGDDRVVPVESDTFLNSWDHSDNHLGIDVNSINSKAYANMSKRLVSDDDVVMTAEISYENLTGVLVALLQIDGDGPPFIVNTSVDMKRDLPQQVSVGFAASTGACIERHQVMSWSFRSTLDDAMVAASTIPRRRAPVHVLVHSVVAAFLVLLCVAAVLGRCIWKKLDDSKDKEREQAEFERGVGPRRYRYCELAATTKNFPEEGKLGRGGFGNVYRGDSLSDQDRPVAIKMLSAELSAQGRKEYESEVKIISRLRHRNLVHLLGWSDSRKGLLLVYELVPEGSLYRHINTSCLLTWPERYKIILGLGSALRYLHTEWDQCVLHGDIKPSNILLDSSRNTKLADFRLARLVEHGAGPLMTQVVMGTVGYIDPEFIRTRRPSTEADVYSFGIVVLEVVSGRRPEMGTGEPADKAIPLLRWIWDLYEKGTIVEAVEERLKGEDMQQLDDVDISKGQMHHALVVGLWCTHPHLGVQPSVVQLMNVLQSEDVTLPTLSPPALANINTGSHASSAIACSDVSWASSGR